MVTNLPGAVSSCDLPVMALIWRIIDMNIVLTGFMGSGKSTCGKMLADITGMNFIDIDTLIEKKTGVTISEIFTHYGEKRFRELESNVIEEVSNMDGCVIATGGGAVMSSRNMDNLRKNGKIIYLHISYDKAMERTKKNIETRPLIHKGKGIKKIYNDRQELYKKNDFEIDADKELPEVMKRLTEILEILIHHSLNYPLQEKHFF